MTPHAHPLLGLPGHFIASKLSERPVDFDWDDDDPDQYYRRESRQLEAKVCRVSFRGQLALAAGLTEWIVYRVAKHAFVPDILDFVAAAWAAVVDYRYAVEWTRPTNLEFEGPALGSQLAAVRLLDDVYLGGPDYDPVDYEVCCLAFLAEHITRRNAAYKTWLKQALARMAELSPMPASALDYMRTSSPTAKQRAAFDWGTPVARVQLDTSVPLDSVNAADSIDAYLRSLDPTTNRFLNTPEQMLELGFEGVPYTYPST